MSACSRRAARARFVLVAMAVPALATAAPAVVSDPTTRVVAANDNRRPAGRLADGTLTLTLHAARGVWRPEGPSGPAVTVEALGETPSALSVPGPMIRVEEGTTIAAAIVNDLDSTLVVNGLCARDGAPCAPIAVPAGERRQVVFDAGRAGTYNYWATSMGAPVPFREMAGAFIVDPRGKAIAPDRVFVITEWNNLTPTQLGDVMRADEPGEAFASLQPRLTFVINGLSWPATERLTYRRGERVHWRVINLSSQQHPMHLHGFYFEVQSLGDGLRDEPITPADRHPVVTQLLRPASTMMLTWTPEREGNWLFHCHIMNHVSSERRLEPPPHDAAGDHAGHAEHDGSAGMAGMIMGITIVKGAAADRAGDDLDHRAGVESRAPRRLTLVMARDTSGGEPSFGFELTGDGVAPGVLSSPGPALVLTRGEPVEITVVNRLGESTALHWHGMELESFYDGVHGWSGVNGRLAPLIEPGKSFVVRFTPPRTGTFMYHTHLHDERQLPLGLYGPMVVVDPGTTFDPATDHVLIVARKGVDPAAPNVFFAATPLVLNGATAPRFVWKAGQRHRVRLINITPDDIVAVALVGPQGPVSWTPVTKDGAPLPSGQRAAVPARQTIAVGETYDFELDAPAGRQNLWIEVRSTAGRWLAQGHVIVR